MHCWANTKGTNLEKPNWSKSWNSVRWMSPKAGFHPEGFCKIRETLDFHAGPSGCTDNQGMGDACVTWTLSEKEEGAIPNRWYEASTTLIQKPIMEASRLEETNVIGYSPLEYRCRYISCNTGNPDTSRILVYNVQFLLILENWLM